MKTLKHIGSFIFLIGSVFSYCAQQNKTAPPIEQQVKTAYSSDNKEEIRKLIRNLYKWEDKNQITIGLTAVTDKNEEKVVGLDTLKNLEFISQLRETNLFSEEFLSNYQKIVIALDQKLKVNEIEWLAGDLPPFGNGSNPWCNCQDVPYSEHWEKIEVTFMDINQSEATLTWTWGQSDWSKSFNYKVRVKKENQKWKIAYLQGFDFDEITKRNY